MDALKGHPLEAADRSIDVHILAHPRRDRRRPEPASRADGARRGCVRQNGTPTANDMEPSSTLAALNAGESGRSPEGSKQPGTLSPMMLQVGRLWGGSALGPGIPLFSSVVGGFMHPLGL